MNAEPETLFHPGVDCGASPLQVGQLQSHDTCKVKEKMLKGLRLGVIKKKKKLFMLRVGREIKSNTSFRGDQNLYILCFFP